MKRGIFSILFALALVLCVSLVIALPAGAIGGNTWYVDPTGTDDASHGTDTGTDAFQTIQYAINDGRVAGGDTINVAAGTYDVATLTTVNKAVAITGPDSGSAIVRGTTADDIRIFKIVTSGVTIKNLEITVASLGAYVADELDNSLVGISGSALSNVSVENNILYVPLQSGPMSGWNARAITVGDSSSASVIITNNTIYNVRNGIVVRTGNTATVTNNTIFNTKGGIMNYTSNQGDADNRTVTGNLWASTVSGVISHNEWDIVWNTASYVPDYQQSVVGMSSSNNNAYVLDRRAAVPANLTGNRSHIFVDAASSFNVANPARGNFNEPFSSISLGVDAVVPGGTVNVLAGEYDEQVVIDKNLTLQGTGDPVITAPGSPAAFTFPESSKQWEPVVFAFGGTNDGGSISGAGTITVDISGFTVDGNDRVPTGRSAGILLRNAGGTISGNTVQNMSIDGKETFGIIAYGDSNVVIMGNDVSGYARGGIGANGDAWGTEEASYPTPYAVIEGNTVTGPGIDEDVTWAPNGIQIGWGATGKIIGNTVSGNGWPGTDWTGSGIIVASSDGVEVDGNTVQQNETGIAVCGYMGDPSGITAEGTWIHDNTVDQNTYGISIQDKSVNTTIEDNTVTNSSYDGIDICNFYGNPPTGTVIQTNTITGNNTEDDETSGGIWVDADVDGNEVTINFNNIEGNNRFGILNTSTNNALDATLNWWGDANGPQADPGQTPDGVNVSTGDKVSNYVHYDPWLGQQWTNQVWVDDDWQIEEIPPYAEDEDNDLYFATIQAAIDAVPPGATINVAAGEYFEHLFIAKSLTLQGAGAGVTKIFQHHVTITVSGKTVVFDGFTVSNAQGLIGLVDVLNGSSVTISNNILHDSQWAIYCGVDTVDSGSTVTIEGNEIYYSDEGIGSVILKGGSELTIQNNNIHDNGEGIRLNEVSADSTVAIVGNTIKNNVEEESGIHLGGGVDATKVRVNFNNITGNEDYGVYNGGTGTLNAKHNWWGSVNGPGEDGANDVTGDVVYAPWLTVPVTSAVSGTVGPGGTLDASAEVGVTVGVTGGSATVTAAKYSGNPGSGSLRGSTGQYVDINLANVVGVTSIEIRVYYTQAELAGKVESSLRLQWWDGADWVGCTPPENSGVTYPAGGPTYRGYMWVKVTATSTPNLGDLEGTPFGGGGTAFVGGGGTVPPTTVSKVGSVSLLQYLDLQGKTRIKIILTSDDDVLTVIIFSATLVQNVGGNPLESMGIVTLSTPPPPPGYALVGHAYDCLPDGANFAPNVTMTFAYDPADIPDGASEADLLAAYWDGDEWVNMPTTVNAAANTATTGVGHFTPFALIAPLPPAAPAAFSVSNLSIQPAEVQPNEVVNITSSVANSGGSEGSYSVVLKINGATEAERSITLAAGESQDVSFSVTKAEAASYNVTIEGLSGSFTVVTPAAEEEAPEAGLPISWTLIWIIAAAVVVVGLIIFFAVRQRA